MEEGEVNTNLSSLPDRLESDPEINCEAKVYRVTVQVGPKPRTSKCRQ